MSEFRGDQHRLDYEVVRAYWDDAADDAASASYMVHEHGLPTDCVDHRFALERAVVDRWFAALGPTASVLDIGCGAGAWTELFAQRYGRVVGVDASDGMLAAARRRLAEQSNVELVRGDALTVALDGEFHGVLLGGLLMYLDRADAVALLVRLGQLAPKGRIILRESGVRAGVEVKTGTYQVAYRSLQEYEAMAAEAGLMPPVGRNGLGDDDVASEVRRRFGDRLGHLIRDHDEDGVADGQPIPGREQHALDGRPDAVRAVRPRGPGPGARRLNPLLSQRGRRCRRFAGTHIRRRRARC